MKNLRITQTCACLIFLVLILFQATAYSAIICVKPAGNDANSGATWAMAKKTLTSAINIANAGDEIWVAGGTYAEHIQIVKEVALYGGFKGDETARDQRDWVNNIAGIDGGGNSSTPPSLDGAVVKISNMVGSGTHLDGFTITGGHGIHGGGINIEASAPVIANNIIKKNRTDGAGAGISIWGYIATTPPKFPLITNNVIVENSSINDEGDGSGIAIVGSSPTISRNVIVRNAATRNGGGIACWRDSRPRIENNTIVKNSANVPLGDSSDTASQSPASYGGGGIFASATDLDGTPILNAVSAPVIINNVLAANGAFKGGGICVVNSIITDLVATIINNTMVANNGSGIYWENTSPTISNNLVAFNAWGLQQGTYGIMSPTISYNNVYGNTLNKEKTDYQGVTDQTGLNGNISADPKMANYRIGDFHLQPGSPCISAGSTGAVGTGWTDIDGQSRVIGSAVDIGADESDGTSWNVPGSVIHVRTDGDDSKDGLTWATAKKTVTSGIGIAAAALTGGEVWVAKGTYTERVILPGFVYLYGGFAGTETDRGGRDISANTTILDGGGKPLAGSNVTVVKSMNAGYLVSRLDGFTIQNGGFYTGGTLSPNGVQGLGGGIYCQVASPYILNNIIKNNSLGHPGALLTGKGGGIALYSSYAVIYSNTIRDNEILYAGGNGQGGGGIYVGNMSMPDIEGNTISQNHAKFGAAIASIGSEPLIRLNLIQNNEMYVSLVYTGSLWGAISMFECPDFVIDRNWIIGNTASIGGGISVNAGPGGNILNNIITGNHAYDYTGPGGGMGGGIYCEVAANSNKDFYILNNTITDNDATNLSLRWDRGGGIAVVADSSTNMLVISNNIIAFNSSGIDSLAFAPHLVSNNDVFANVSDLGENNYINLPSGNNDISVDPDFANRPGLDFHLNPTSPCIDAGSNAVVPIWLTTDFDDHPRIFHGQVDMGAFEFYRPNVIDFNGDASTDIAIYRASTGAWYVKPSSGAPPYGVGWGGDATDKPVPGDFDGDGKTDIAIYRTSTGAWYVYPSKGGAPYGVGFGGDPSDKPVPGDYDGDGKTDIAVDRTSTGAWYIYPSKSGAPYGVGWGGDPSDKPVPGDYDGDGKTDIAVYRANTGAWYVKPSSGAAAYGVGWGGDPNDKPVPGDYDGDRKTDIAVYRASTGAWYVKPSGGGAPYGVGWGGDPSDKPVPGDYDGDGKTDIAVYRANTGAWYVKPSSGAAAYGVGWGGNATDLPVITNPGSYM